MSEIVHHHLLYYAKVGVKKNEKGMKSMFLELLRVLDMTCLIQPQLALSHQNAWTGLMGIITSHITFHYWIEEGYVQFDIYSCKSFDAQKAKHFLDSFWDATETETLFIERDGGFTLHDSTSKTATFK